MILRRTNVIEQSQITSIAGMITETNCATIVCPSMELYFVRISARYGPMRYDTQDSPMCSDDMR